MMRGVLLRDYKHMRMRMEAAKQVSMTFVWLPPKHIYFVVTFFTVLHAE
jgi:hypothetical protein